jgi:hypothetical protein
MYWCPFGPLLLLLMQQQQQMVLLLHCSPAAVLHDWQLNAYQQQHQ